MTYYWLEYFPQTDRQKHTSRHTQQTCTHIPIYIQTQTNWITNIILQFSWSCKNLYFKQVIKRTANLQDLPVQRQRQTDFPDLSPRFVRPTLILVIVLVPGRPLWNPVCKKYRLIEKFKKMQNGIFRPLDPWHHYLRQYSI